MVILSFMPRRFDFVSRLTGVTCQLIVVFVLTSLHFMAEAGIHFTNVTQQAGLDYLQWKEGVVPLDRARGSAYMTGGAAAGDFDGDGWTDLFVTRLDAPGILFRNKGDGTFEDVTAASGIPLIPFANGAAWVDVDNDGDLDLYVTAIYANRYFLFINDGKGHFTEQAQARGAAVASDQLHYGFSVTIGDYDRDGWLDIHTTDWGNYLEQPEYHSHARLLRNRGATAPGFFTDVTVSAGADIPPEIGFYRGIFAFTSSIIDVDGDGWPDLVIAGDFGTSRLFWNNKDGTFSDGSLVAQVGSEENGMGSAIGDIDGDGLMDWFVTSIYDPFNTCLTKGCGWGGSGNRMYRNRGNRTFADVTDSAGVRAGGWGWGAALFDYDNDGDLDLAMVNGMGTPTPLMAQFAADPMRLWRNEGGVFTEVSHDVGLDDTGSGKAIVVFDYDNDGDLDLFIVNNAGHPVLYRNDGGNSNSWLRVKTVGYFSNRNGIGTRIIIEPMLGGKRQVREITPGNHFLGQSETIAHFGLGSQTNPVARVTLHWSSGLTQEFRNVSPKTVLVANEPSDPYSTWLVKNFTPAQLDDPAISGKYADADRDGLPNILEFAFGRDPNVPDLGRVLTASLESNITTKAFQPSISFSVRDDIPDFINLFEVSFDLSHWDSAAPFVARTQTSVGPGGMQKVVLTFGAALPRTSSLFIRVRPPAN